MPSAPRPCRVVHEPIESQVLVGNRFGDPTLRVTPVILPPGYDDEPGRRYPVIVLLAAFTSTGWHMLARSPLSEAIDERLARLYAGGGEGAAMDECIVVLPDCFTVLGGSQYVNSPALGRYEDHVVDEVLPLIDRRYRTAPRRAVLGRSSGGIGAMWLAMRHPGLFHAVGCHAGDSAFAVTQVPELLKFCRRVRRYGGPQGLLDKLLQLGKAPRPGDIFDLMTVMANGAAYSPEPEAPLGFTLPVDWETGVIDHAVLARWRRFDPVEICAEEPHASALRGLRLVFLDAGNRDEYYLDLGMRQLARRLAEVGAKVQHEEFDDGHMSTAYRYDRSLPLLARALAE